MPYTWYFEGTLTVVESGGSFTITLPNERLNESNLYTWLQTELNANTVTPYTYTVTYDTTQKKYTIGATGNFVMNFGSAGVYDFPKILGFPASNTSNTNSHVSSYVSNLNEQQLCLYVNPIPTNLYTTDSSGANFIIPVNANWGDIIFCNRNTSFLQSTALSGTTGFNIRNFEVSLQHMDGRKISSLNVEGDVNIVFSVGLYDV